MPCAAGLGRVHGFPVAKGVFDEATKRAPDEGAVAALGLELRRMDFPLGIGVKDAQVGGTTFVNAAGVQLADFGALPRQQGDDPLEAEVARRHQSGD